MKKYNLIFVFAIMLLSLGSCEKVDFGNINKNTNGPSEFDAEALLTGAQAALVGVSPFTWSVDPGIYVQYTAQPVYQEASRYQNDRYDFDAMYQDVLSPLHQVIKLASDPEISASKLFQSKGAPANQIAVAKLMKAFTFKRITDAFGPIPYTEALNPEILLPKYTPQKDVYAGIIKTIKEARALIDVTKPGPTGDIYYGGNMNKWGKFANSLLLNIAMQMSEKDAATAKGVFTEALGNAYGVIETVADEAWYTPVNLGTLDNPWTNIRPADYNLSEFFQNAFQGDQPVGHTNTTFDARLNIYSTTPTAEGLPYGLADYTGVSSTAKISGYVSGPLSPTPLITSSYIYLQRAEAAAMTWTTEDPTTMLTKGIEQSYISVTKHFGMGPEVENGGLTPIDITSSMGAYVSARVSDAGVNPAAMLQVIREEKYASLFPQGMQAWNERRRTGVPALNPAVSPLNNGDIPTRYRYPNTESNINTVNYKAASQLLVPAEDLNSSRVWWDAN